MQYTAEVGALFTETFRHQLLEWLLSKILLWRYAGANDRTETYNKVAICWLKVPLRIWPLKDFLLVVQI